LNLYIDWLFFVETGFTPIFLKTLSAKIGTALFFSLGFLLFVMANVIIATRIGILRREFFVIEGVIHPFRTGSIERFIKPLSIAAALLVALFAGQWGSLKWEEFLLYKNTLDMEISEPVLGGI